MCISEPNSQFPAIDASCSQYNNVCFGFYISRIISHLIPKTCIRSLSVSATQIFEFASIASPSG